jgi:RHS repeat-associated protein
MDHTDHITGVGPVTNSSGALVQLLDYHPFGTFRIDSQYVSGIDEQRKFTGQEYDRDTGLNYYNARYYNSAIGRFISEDPSFLLIGDGTRFRALTGQLLLEQLSDPQQQNSYSYVRNNPLIYTDPTGLGIWSDTWNTGKEAPKAFVNAIKQESNSIVQGMKLAWNNYENNSKAQVLVLGYLVLQTEPGFYSSKTTNTTTRSNTLMQNKAAGNAFEAKQAEIFRNELTNLQSQVTLKTQSGIKTRIDFMGIDSSGRFCLVECKSSATAPLTKNQSLAFPEIERSGATVVGKGKPGIPEGTFVGPTKPQVVRP